MSTLPGEQVKTATSLVAGSDYVTRGSVVLRCEDPQYLEKIDERERVHNRGSWAKTYSMVAEDEGLSRRLMISDVHHHEDRGVGHLQSADLFDFFSPVQKERQRKKPVLSDQLSGPTVLVDVEIPGLIKRDVEELAKIHTHLGPLSSVEVHSIGYSSGNHLPSSSSGLSGMTSLPAPIQGTVSMNLTRRRSALRVGIVLSGGPAPGGHNVIAGLYDHLKQNDIGNQLIGFMGGLDGFFKKDFKIVDDSNMDRFRNSGGFDMLWSGRGRVFEEDKSSAKEIVEALELSGLIIVGGDGSNSNAAILAEYFAENNISCCVIGIPKTIDGDLKSSAIEVSFGFDTAAKTYSELIGNLCTDVCCGQGVYHFVRVMGRSASHLVFECAMQTRPNLALIGEEIFARNIRLKDIVADIVQLVIDRFKLNKNYGIILVPEGLIEFIPEMKTLISELSVIISSSLNAITHLDLNPDSLSPESRDLWYFLPEGIREQLFLDREATGYIQVAKIATERMLLLLVESSLSTLGVIGQQTSSESSDKFGETTRLNFEWNRMHHYFGYEGRCAMPSNFDVNYCYNLGFTAGCLIEHKKNGYMACIRNLEQYPTEWQPCGVPFPKMMEMITGNSPGVRFPGIIRQLLDIESESFRVFQEARVHWRLGDYYRCPGPIQFEGANSDISNYTVKHPSLDDLLGEDLAEEKTVNAFVPKRLGCYSPLQRERLQYKPPLPSLCLDKLTRCTPGNQYLPKDPYVRRQILTYYPELCKQNDFNLQEVSDDFSVVSNRECRIGIVFISRQSPGMQNVVWGVYERLKLVGGVCIGFIRGVAGLLDKRYIEINEIDLIPFKNMGGVDLLGRGTSHQLLKEENKVKVLRVCEELRLNGLLLVGSSFGMTEAALLSEFFLQQNCRTSIIGVPATASNNVLHDLIETNIGFDTASKLYSNLIGNVLADAASMPKYWHFVRLMGRQPSNEVLECALQTHPNIVIIAEEYGAAQKTLADVVNDIADVITRRANPNSPKGTRNFGAVLIPDGLWHHLPTMRLLFKEIDQILLRNDNFNSFKKEDCQKLCDLKLEEKLSPWSSAIWKSLPKYIQRELVNVNPELRDSSLETELLLSQMVKSELAKRKRSGLYQGNFQSVGHYFGYQGRSAMPSNFDCKLAFAHGHLAAICVESGLTGHLTNVRGLCGDVKEWKLTAVPFNCLLTIIPVQQDLQVHPDLNTSRRSEAHHDLPLIPNAEVNLQCKALRWMKVARRGWEDQDRFCNPGPIQFTGTSSSFYHRILHEEQADYFHMLQHVQKFARILQSACHFGVEETFLKAAYVSLNGLLTLRFHSDDVIRAMTAFPKLEAFEARDDENKNHPRDEDGQQRMRRLLSIRSGQESQIFRNLKLRESNASDYQKIN